MHYKFEILTKIMCETVSNCQIPNFQFKPGVKHLRPLEKGRAAGFSVNLRMLKSRIVALHVAVVF